MDVQQVDAGQCLDNCPASTDRRVCVGCQWPQPHAFARLCARGYRPRQRGSNHRVLRLRRRSGLGDADPGRARCSWPGLTWLADGLDSLTARAGHPVIGPLDELVDRWCERRDLVRLSRVLPPYVQGPSGLAGWRGFLRLWSAYETPPTRCRSYPKRSDRSSRGSLSRQRGP